MAIKEKTNDEMERELQSYLDKLLGDEKFIQSSFESINKRIENEKELKKREDYKKACEEAERKWRKKYKDDELREEWKEVTKWTILDPYNHDW